MVFSLKVSYRIAILIFTCSFFLGILLVLIIGFMFFKKWFCFRLLFSKLNRIGLEPPKKTMAKNKISGGGGVATVKSTKPAEIRPTTITIMTVKTLNETTTNTATKKMSFHQNKKTSIGSKFLQNKRLSSIQAKPRASYINVGPKYMFVNREQSPKFKNYLHKSNKPFLGYSPHSVSKERDRTLSYFY